MKLRKGLLRLGLSLSALWSVFWACAFVISPSAALKYDPTPGAVVVTALVVMTPWLLATIAVGIWWIVAGFRSSANRPN
jgi:hypothetical protein